MNNTLKTLELPYNIEAEQILIGCILINPQHLNNVIEFLRPEHFYENLHQKIYQAILTLSDKDITPTVIAMKTILDKEISFQEVSGVKYFTEQLMSIAFTIINPIEYARIIYDCAVKRGLIEIGQSIANKAYDKDITYDAVKQIEEAEEMLYNLASSGISERSFSSLAISIETAMDKIHKAQKSAKHITGISTGFSDLDLLTSGLQNSDLIILAGRPSMGKTAFSIALALNACNAMKADNLKEHSKSVGFFSLEMSSEQIAYRLLSSLSMIDTTSLRSGWVENNQYGDLSQASIDLQNIPLFIDDTPALSIAAIRTRARKLKRKHNLGLLIIDYLQLIKGDSKYNSLVHEITSISQGLKSIAKELDIPVIALSQLSRNVESRDDKRPMLSDLRESGSIEQDADIVMFIYREEYYLERKKPKDETSTEFINWKATYDKHKNICDIIIAKNRNGSVRSIPLYYDSKFSRFHNLST